MTWGKMDGVPVSGGVRPLVVSRDGVSCLLQPLDALSTSMQQLTDTLAAHIKETRKARRTGRKKAEDNNEGLTRNSQTVVYLRLVFLKIGEIDTVKEHFAADVFIQARWREPLLDTATAEELEEFDPDLFWNPKLFIENVSGDPKEKVWYQIVQGTGGAMVHEKRRIKETFVENMELRDFPFDSQELNVIVMSQRPIKEVEIEGDKSDICSVNVQSFVDQQEWSLHDYVEMKPRRTNNQMTGTPQIQRSGLAVWCKAHRRPQFFMWNIMLVMVFICSLSFATFAVDVDSPQGRLVPSFTLVLTMITFKYTVNQSLPKISYLTYLDRYILCSMVMLCTVAIWHASVSAVVDRWSVGTARTADRCVIVTVACLYIVFHIVFFFIIFCRTRQHKLSAEEKHIQYQENLAKVLNLPSPHFDLSGRGWRTFSNRVGAESMS